ncbi:MAG: hypothetical protein ACHQHN_13960 [Sphingobacteriales bacterium]
MDSIKLLSEFFLAIEKDARINAVHIGVYAALLHAWSQHGFIDPLSAYSREIMQIAKISAQATYHAKLKDLHAFGYIHYEPSFNRNKPSKVFLLNSKS